jgi:NADH-quinone oxidoreductase subunit M
MDIVYLQALVVFPVISLAASLLLNKWFKWEVSMLVSLVGLVLTGIVVGPALCQGLPSTIVVDCPWIEELGIHFKLGLDGISLILILLTNLSIPLILLSARRHAFAQNSYFHSLVFLMQIGLTGVFTSLDAFLFYVFWEVALIPIYFICAIWGGENKVAVTFKFFIYTVVGSLCMLIGIIYLYLQTPGNHSFDLEAFKMVSLDQTSQIWLFWAFFIAFAIKMPIFPFHTWQPDTYTTAPAQGSMLLSGVMLKMGVFGVIRWILPLFPLAVAQYSCLIITLSIVGVVYGAVIAIMQKDMKKLIAYSSISHVGLISAGLFTGNLFGIQGAVIQMLSHGINVIGLFFIIDIIENRTGTRQIADLGGVRNVAPKLATFFAIIMLGSVALPLTNGFVGEFLLLTSVFKYKAIFAAFAGLSVILGAVYMLRMYKTTMLGETNATTGAFQDVDAIEFIGLSFIVLLVVVIGVYPQALLSLSEPEAVNVIKSFVK